MTETRTAQEMNADVDRMLDEYESRKQRRERLAAANEENRRRGEATSLLEQEVPSFTAPLRSLAASQRKEVASVQRDLHLSEEGKAAQLRKMPFAQYRLTPEWQARRVAALLRGRASLPSVRGGRCAS
jgi:nitric oxide reductase activation protein